MMFVKQRYAGTLLAVIAVFGLAGCDGASQAQDAPTRPQVSVMTLAGQDLVISEDLPARVAAVRSAEIRAQISGIVQRRLFEQGARIPLFDKHHIHLVKPPPGHGAAARAHRTGIMARGYCE